MDIAFDIEYAKLNDLIDYARSHTLTISEIISTYYQIINVTSMSKVLHDIPDMHSKIAQTDELISDFIQNIHPKILANLDSSIQTMTVSLKDDPKSGSFSELRKIMSTRDFVLQYQNL